MRDQQGEGGSMSIREQAALWFVRLVAGDLNYAERLAYLAWLKVSPVHIAEFLRICRTHARLAAAGLEPSESNASGAANVISFGNSKQTQRPALRPLSPAPLWRARLATAISVVFVVVLLTLATKLNWLDRSSIVTDAGEWRTVMLTDGTTLRAGPRTRLRTRFSDAARIVDLSHGELMAEVAKDVARPFSVRAGDVIVTATGTQFAVDRQSSHVVVTVAEGSVRVGAGVVDTARAVALRTGEQVTFSGESSAPVQQVNLERELAWAARRLVFESETVQEAVNEFNRRNRLQLTIDPALRARAVRGGFDADNPESFARSIAAGLNGQLVWKSPQVLSVEPSPRSRP